MRCCKNQKEKPSSKHIKRAAIQRALSSGEGLKTLLTQLDALPALASSLRLKSSAEIQETPELSLQRNQEINMLLSI